MILHEYAASGNCYKARLIAALTGQQLSRVQHDILAGATRTADFLKRINANGRIPVLELDDGTMLAESNAILFYLGADSAFWPSERLGQAKVLEWLNFEQYSHEPNIATVRFWRAYLGEARLTQVQRAQLPGRIEQGHAALAVMESHLHSCAWMVGDGPTLADIALYAYTHVAPEGGFDLTPYVNVRRWLDQVGTLPGHVPITA